MKLKTTLYALALAAMLAGPVLAKTTNWTDGDAGNHDFDDADNWSNGVPVDADTVQYLDSTKTLPDANFPNAGETFIIVLRDDVGSGWTVLNGMITLLGNGDWNYSALTIGGTEEHDSLVDALEQDSAVGGTITVHAETYLTGNLANAAITVESGGQAVDSSGYTFTQKLTVNAGGIFETNAALAHTVLPGGCDLAGTIWFAPIAAGEGIDSATPISVTADGAAVDWNHDASEVGTIWGGFDADGHTVTHSNTTGATLTCDQDGDLDLGTDTANGIAVDVAADVTIGDDFTCYKFDGSSGVITGAAKTITVGSGGLTNGGATLDAVGTLNVIVAETPAAFDWAVANSNHSLGTLTVNAATTMTDTVYTTKVAGSAAIAIDARLYVRAMAADFWTNTATHSGSNRFVMYAYTGSHANTALINIGTCEFQVVGFDGTTTTLNGGLTCGVLDLNATAQNLVVNGPLSASGNTTLDDATLTLGSAATHSFGGTITSGSTGILIIDGTSTFAGAVDTTGITLTVAAASTVVFSDTLTIGDTATFTAGVTSFTADGFVLNATGKTLTGGGNTITVGAGGLTRTAGDLDAAGTLHVTFGDDVTTTVFVWASSPKPLGTITLGANSDVTLSGYAYLQKLSGGATATLNVANTVLRFKGATANLWDFDGTCTGTTGRVEFNGLSGDVTNAKIIDVGLADFRVQVANHTATLSAGLVCDNLVVSGYGSGTGTLVLAGPLTVATNLTLGEAGNNTDGILTMAAGEDNSIGGTVGTAGTGTGHELNLAGHVTLGDDVTGAEIAFDFGSVIIEASATLTIDLNNATSVANTDGTIFANGQALTVSNVDYATTSAPIICVSCVDGTGNGVAVEFQEPQRTMMGVGF